jgi:glycosyltransferase involved in cell wall biosynthesis
MSIEEAKFLIQAPPTGMLVGAIGRLSDEKAFNLLVRAVADLIRQGQDIHLWIAGEGPERARIEAEIGRHGLQERVKLLGLVSDPRLLLQAIDLFVLSSLREGLPNVVLEAMATETPVVATRIAGVPGLLDNGNLGLLVEPGSVESLSAGIARLAADENLRRQFAVLARQRIEEHYSFKHRMQRVAAIYDRLLDRGGARSSCVQRKSA